MYTLRFFCSHADEVERAAGVAGCPTEVVRVQLTKRTVRRIEVLATIEEATLMKTTVADPVTIKPIGGWPVIKTP